MLAYKYAHILIHYSLHECVRVCVRRNFKKAIIVRLSAHPLEQLESKRVSFVLRAQVGCNIVCDCNYSWKLNKI